MKNIVLMSVAVAMLVLTGCSQKSPEVDTTKSADTKVSSVSDSVGATPSVSDDGSSLARLIASLEANTKVIYFDFDKFNIRKDQQSSIEQDAVLFNSKEANNFSVKVEGNCDEWGTDEYNYALGLKRAKSVKDALAAQGVNAERLMVVSYGESNPTCTDKNKACWDKNRRAEFKILP
ncbi:MAG: peptidoglycan-associated lipoprotein Pal [Sulfurospirillaceae bacterium]|nr:peptidoglycan-associated lipoprotein Pal [Sulfurospirillaceae bacterium]MDD3463122.1 peptidoglycan-associated lipoprotein Pal [Sulfurospirillaceae bacterium]